MAFQSSDGKPAARVRRNPLGRLADHFHVPDDSVLQFLGRHEGVSSGPDEAGDPQASLQHVMQVQPIVFHSGVASRRILSRTYQCSDFSVPTWTFIPSSS